MQPTITLPNGKIKQVKNLGWLIRHKPEIAYVQAFMNGSIVAETYSGIVYRCTFADMSVRYNWLDKHFPHCLIYTSTYAEINLPDPVFTYDDLDYWYAFDTSHTCQVCAREIPHTHTEYVCGRCLLLASQALVNAVCDMRESVGISWAFGARNPAMDRLYDDTCHYMIDTINWQEQYQ